MLVTKMRHDGEYFFLAESVDQDELERDIITAVQAGGGFVRFDTRGHGRVSVLMAANFPVRFESVERSEAEVASWEDKPPSIDVDPDSYL